MFFKPVLPVVEYVVLYDYIKNELCVNKDKPELECNGKCHLKKEMAHASDTKTEKNKVNFASAELQIMYYQALEMISAVVFNPYRIKNDRAVTSLYSFSFSNLLFRPPVF
ncbi:hypothetical protein [Myroides odoratus]|uniref:Uncharacterized protein n=1 Tax=Myroides odoratus TaxID=256 RepID=A0A9Q6ZAY3_MYROD|nr:hypothetical protein [Myroides odoratus]EHQ44533.1 hypothetical protein Myrod_3737 [Myroides odoratus DSM 2801]EKB03580.1 hypothetical protein HMPREF9716_03545 [Myroides odoratus CIP 103059]QQU01798.1 hypothetical protein I6I88_08680 [Myroides odoratus]WQD55917.1 hypothetical protein U0010_10300 [Myroides odoratus]STZ31870.1 Uncharacterised protein [Myroides odoratus]